MKILKKILISVLVLFIALAGYMFINRNSVDSHIAQKTLNEDHCYKYFYSLLDDSNKDIYAKLYYSFSHNLKSIELLGVEKDDIVESYKAVLFDHPEFYYIDKTFQYVNLFDNYEVRILYTYTDNQRKVYDSALNSIASNIQDLTKGKSDLEKVQYIYDYLIDLVVYQQTDNDQDMISALVDHKSVCAGYAKAYQYLLNSVGVDSTYIQGKAKEEVNGSDKLGHAWIMLHLNGDVYYSDVTWGDVTQKDFVHHCDANFLMSQEEMLNQYIPDCPTLKTKDKSFDYFKHTGRYMTTFNESIISNAASYAYNKHSDVLEIKCASKAIVELVENKLNHSQMLYHILNQTGINVSKAQYIKREANNIIEIHFYN